MISEPGQGVGKPGFQVELERLQYELSQDHAPFGPPGPNTKRVGSGRQVSRSFQNILQEARGSWSLDSWEQK